MIKITPNQNESWAVATINGKNDENDFDKMTSTADELITEAGMHNGINLNAIEFIDWENPRALLNPKRGYNANTRRSSTQPY